MLQRLFKSGQLSMVSCVLFNIFLENNYVPKFLILLSMNNLIATGRVVMVRIVNRLMKDWTQTHMQANN